MTEFGWQPAALSGIAQGLQARGLGRDGRSAFMTLLSSDSEAARSARQRVQTILSRASALALDERAPADLRLAAIGLLGHTDYSSAGRTLESLLAPRHPSEVQVAAVRALSQLPGRPPQPAWWSRAAGWRSRLQMREAVLSVLVTRRRADTGPARRAGNGCDCCRRHSGPRGAPGS